MKPSKLRISRINPFPPTNTLTTMWVMLAVLVFLVCLQNSVDASRAYFQHLTVCPNSCSGQGVCMNATATAALGECSCFPGFVGVDCSQRMCPAGVAWVDFPSANNTAHANFTECSNMGNCNRATGQCECRFGFSGPACDAMSCPMGPQMNCAVSTRFGYCGHNAVCTGHGKCMSLRYASALADYNTLFDSTQYEGWDTDMIHGCVCDDGWEGPNCDQKICPKGDNPDTTGQVDEIQLFDCKCTRCEGGMYITINNKATGYIPYTATEAVVRHMIEKTGALEQFSLFIVNGKTVCSTGGSTTKLVIHVPTGPQPAMIITTTEGLHGNPIKVRTGDLHGIQAYSTFYPTERAQKGTKEYLTCSGQGMCNVTQGNCACYSRYGSSDGRGNAGTRGDCGYEKYVFEQAWLSSDTLINTSCPVSNGVVCSGHGHCMRGDRTSAYSYCSCDYPWSKFVFAFTQLFAVFIDVCMCLFVCKWAAGEACEYQECPYTKSWFGDVGTSHNLVALCSGVGICNYTNGTC
jgi:hypothetical protein